MSTTKTGAVAIGTVALLVALTACAGLRGNDAQPANLPQSQHELQQSVRQETAAMRAELRAAATSVQAALSVEVIRTAKQSEARAEVGPSPADVQGQRLAKYAAALSASDAQRRHFELEHGASSERLR
ncbi:hypothetical protein [Agromyces sp. CCNWLW203]|uniref:hypothetical protein n=1 Tax=Agromyces sp. CCNWLW203 TaxID=3112842 RepID=UPI002F966792